MSENENNRDVDIFLWANKVDAHKDDVQIDLFLFTKGYTAYATDYAKDLKSQLKVLFLYDMISQVQVGAATGMIVKNIVDSDAEENLLEWTELDIVPHGLEVIEQIQYDENNLEMFNEGDHEIGKVKGIVARLTLPDMEPFYIVKLLGASQVMKGKVSWEFSEDGRFSPMRAAASVKVPPDNQVLVHDGRVFIFDSSKFARLFGYDPRTDAAIVSKIAGIEKHFKLKYPEGVTMYDIIREAKELQTKVLRVDPTSVSQDQVIALSDELDLALMTDDSTGQIIIMDKRDAGVFINLLLDNYVDSNMTGVHYLANNKKEVRPVEDSQMNMGI